MNVVIHMDIVRRTVGTLSQADLLRSWGWPSSGLRGLPSLGFSSGGASGLPLPSTGMGLRRAAARVSATWQRPTSVSRMARLCTGMAMSGG